MNIFVSWSGERSRAIAEALRDWLPYVFPAAQPWMSAADIDRGSRWSVEISQQLDKANVGIICLTPENLDAPWVLFEAGALSRALTRTLVCTYLFQVRATDVKGPLSQFQSTQAEMSETRKLLGSMNRALEAQALPEDRLNKMFERWWPDLERKLAELKTVKGPNASPHRSDRDILEEILSLSRRNDVRTMVPELASVFRDEMEIPPVELEKGRWKSSRKHPDAVVFVDTRPLIGVDGDEVGIPYPLFGNVSDLLDSLHGFVHTVVLPGTFGRLWALRDPKTGREYRDMGRTWAKANLQRETDSRPLEMVGIEPGMHLEAIPLVPPSQGSAGA